MITMNMSVQMMMETPVMTVKVAPMIFGLMVMTLTVMELVMPVMILQVVK